MSVAGGKRVPTTTPTPRGAVSSNKYLLRAPLLLILVQWSTAAYSSTVVFQKQGKRQKKDKRGWGGEKGEWVYGKPGDNMWSGPRGTAHCHREESRPKAATCGGWGVRTSGV